MPPSLKESAVNNKRLEGHKNQLCIQNFQIRTSNQLNRQRSKTLLILDKLGRVKIKLAYVLNIA